LEIETPALEKLYRIIMRSVRRGVSDPSVRKLASVMKRSMRTIHRYLRALVRLGKLVVQTRRRTGDRNDTSIYILPDLLGGVYDKGVVEKRGEVLKTTTPSPEALGSSSPPAKPKSDLQALMEARFAQDKADAGWRRREYERKATFWDTMKGWRLSKAIERTRRAMEAQVGVFTPPPPHEFVSSSEPEFCLKCGFKSGYESHVGAAGTISA
jgi:hypothetical protein